MEESLWLPDFPISDFCARSGDGNHQPNWGTATIDYDHESIIVDINCVHCGQSGSACISRDDINWA